MTPATGQQAFNRLWLGQLISALGTGLGSFATGVWVFEQNRSAVQFSLLAVSGGLTALLVAPLAGSLADRFDRRRLMLGCNLLAAAATLTIALLLITGRLQPWHAYPINAVMTALGIVQGPAFMASVSQLVAPERLARAGGMTQASAALAQIVGPPAAAALVPWIGFGGVLLIDFASFGCCALTLLLVRIPSPAAAPAGHAGGAGAAPPAGTLAGLGDAWRYLRARPPLAALLALLTVSGLAAGAVQMLLTPLVLAIGTRGDLGLVSSLGAVGSLAGALAMAVWGARRRRAGGILAGLAVQGLLLIYAGFRPGVLKMALCAAAFMAAGPVIYSLAQAIWQTQVRADLQGRVFGLRQTLASASLSLAFFGAGQLADRFAGPRGALTAAIRPWAGGAPGAGLGLLICGAGLLTLVTAALAAASPLLRVEDASAPAPGLGKPLEAAPPT